MAKKRNTISINALEKHCKDKETPNVKLVFSAGTDDISCEIKTHLSLEESMRFVSDVVNESVRANDLMLIPLAKEFITRRNVLTYYANFTMPTDMNKAYELVVGAADIIDNILSYVDRTQYQMIIVAIDKGVEFEQQKMLSLQTVKVDNAISEINQFITRMTGLFEGIDGEQMAQFVSGMSNVAKSTEVTPQDLASAMIATAEERKAD